MAPEGDIFKTQRKRSKTSIQPSAVKGKGVITSKSQGNVHENKVHII